MCRYNSHTYIWFFVFSKYIFATIFFATNKQTKLSNSISFLVMSRFPDPEFVPNRMLHYRKKQWYCLEQIPQHQRKLMFDRKGKWYGRKVKGEMMRKDDTDGPIGFQCVPSTTDHTRRFLVLNEILLHATTHTICEVIATYSLCGIV